MKKTSRGFTLIELLVVIAIIGILAGVVLTNLSSAQGKARTARAQATMHTVQTAAVVCQSDGLAIATTSAVVIGTTPICAGSTALYPALPSGWVYGTFVGAASATDFTITAVGDSKTITCTTSNCATN